MEEAVDEKLIMIFATATDDYHYALINRRKYLACAFQRTPYLTKTILAALGNSFGAERITERDKNYMMSDVDSYKPIFISEGTRNLINDVLNDIRNGKKIALFIQFLRETKDIVIKSKYFIPFVTSATIVVVYTILAIIVQFVRSK
ncbi:hypothetical protein MHBO_001539 [Bonamia ostreae]|uniref:Uncharacterized protein n=1 Tax=Bonamia ostreae TaxID=126728 RepID=A0ABV2AJA4_9EUKA